MACRRSNGTPQKVDQEKVRVEAYSAKYINKKLNSEGQQGGRGLTKIQGKIAKYY